MNFFEPLAVQASKTIPITDKDYIGADGLYICGVCGEPKQCRVLYMGIGNTVHCACKCVRNELEAEQKTRFKNAVNILRDKCIPRKELHSWRFEKDDGGSPEIMKIARGCVAKWEEMQRRNKGIIFCGSVGIGKTFAAVCIANALIDKYISAKITSIGEIVADAQRRGDDPGDIACMPDLIIIDDLASERSTPYMIEQTGQIINARAQSGKPMIVTTNMTIEKLKSCDDNDMARIYDRILGACFPVEFAAPSRRRAEAKSSYHEIKELLGI